MLTKDQFNVLDCLLEPFIAATAEQLPSLLGETQAKIQEILSDLQGLGYLDGEGKATDSGIQVMENYKVQRAVVIAAGFGSRLLPITINTPKPLIRVHGKRMIDSTLDALTEVGIKEIYVVRGYLKEQFDQLLYQYPTVKFIDNPNYDKANNISSAIALGDLLKNTYIIEGDLTLHNKKLIKRYQYETNYCGIPTPKTDDWCLYQKDGYISDMVYGGENCHLFIGISYWTEKDGERLIKDLKEVFATENGAKHYWDDVPLLVRRENYKVAIRDCTRDDVVEIDSFEELKQIDKAYC